MGVLQCDRLGCDNVMCDRLSQRYGYICWECFDELVTSGVFDVESFMGQRRDRTERPDQEFYEKIFPDRQD